MMNWFGQNFPRTNKTITLKSEKRHLEIFRFLRPSHRQRINNFCLLTYKTVETFLQNFFKLINKWFFLNAKNCLVPPQNCNLNIDEQKFVSMLKEFLCKWNFQIQLLTTLQNIFEVQQSKQNFSFMWAQWTKIFLWYSTINGYNFYAKNCAKIICIPKWFWQNFPQQKMHQKMRLNLNNVFFNMFFTSITLTKSK